MAASIACVVAGCGGGKSAAQAEVRKVEAICAAGNPDEARETLYRAAEKNKVLKEAVRFATAGYADVPNMNPCGPVLTEIKTQLGLGTKPSTKGK